MKEIIINYTIFQYKTFNMLAAAFVSLLFIFSHSNMIAFFDTDCPAGWETYAPALDRTLVSAGGRYIKGDTGG